MPAVFDPDVRQAAPRDERQEGQEQVGPGRGARCEDIARFKREQRAGPRWSMVWCGSTEMLPASRREVHQTLDDLRGGPEAERPDIAPSHDLRLRGPAGGRPLRQRRAQPVRSTSRRLVELARAKRGADLRQGLQDRPDADEDHHRPRPQGAACSGSTGWFSTNILGNRDGEVLDDPESLQDQGGLASSACSSTSCSRTSIPTSTARSTTRCASTTTRRAATTRRAGTTSTSSAGSATRCRSRSTSSAATRILAAPLVLDLALFLGPGRAAPACAASRSGSRSTSRAR